MRGKILWIHGWGMSQRVWADGAERLPGYDHHYIHFGDCREAADFSRTVERILMKSPGNWTMIGWSMGGMLALEAAMQTETRQRSGIAAVAVVGSTLRFVNSDRAKGWPLRIVERMRTQLRLQPDETLANFARSMFTPEEMKQWNGDPSSLVDGSDFSPEGLEAGLAYLIERDLTGDWLDYRTMTEIGVNPDAPRMLWIHGGDDPICPPGAMPDLPDGCKIVMEGAGHAPFLTQKESFYQHLGSFLYDRN